MSSRYLKQLITSGIGLHGQERLSRARVIVVGAGGLGTYVASSLWAAGIGELHIYDGDLIEESNLARQIHYGLGDIGKSKVEVLSHRLRLNRNEPGLISISKNLTEDNVISSLQEAQIVCDCTDNAAARILLANTCEQIRVPLVYAAVREWIGYITILNGEAGIQLSDIFSNEELFKNAGRCDEAGILGTTCGVVANIQANEAIKVLLREKSGTDGKLLAVDLRNLTFRLLTLRPAGSK